MVRRRPPLPGHVGEGRGAATLTPTGALEEATATTLLPRTATQPYTVQLMAEAIVPRGARVSTLVAAPDNVPAPGGCLPAAVRGT